MSWAASVVSVPMVDQISAAKVNAFQLTGLAMLGFVVVLLAQWLLVGRPLVDRLKAMEQAASRISMGEMDAQFDSTGTDEVGQLAKSV